MISSWPKIKKVNNKKKQKTGRVSTWPPPTFTHLLQQSWSMRFTFLWKEKFHKYDNLQSFSIITQKAVINFLLLIFYNSMSSFILFCIHTAEHPKFKELSKVKSSAYTCYLNNIAIITRSFC